MNEPNYTDAQLEKVAIRLDELVIAVADWRMEEFTMRIPAEPDRDADLVMQRAAHMLRSLLSERQAAMQGQPKVYRCPRCATSMQVDPTAKPASAHRSVSDEDVEAVLTAAGRGDFHRADVRAALEHFAVIAQEKQS